MRNYSFVIVTIALMLFASCGDSVKLKGRFTGVDQGSVYLEKITPAYKGIVDSTLTDKKGNFKFKINLQNNQPTIYNISFKGKIIPLLLSPGEIVEVTSIYGVAKDYTVSGSEGSEQIREINSILSTGAAALDSVRTKYSKLDPNDDMRKTVASAFTEIYYKAKREHVRFIVENCSSLSAIYALYQRMPNDAYLGNGDNDVIYYRMVADSVETRYPDSPYLIALKKQVESTESTQSLADILNSDIVKEATFPDIEIADMYSVKHKLSALIGKVIVLDFWSLAFPQSKMLNAELRELYNEVGPDKLVVYQVSLDTDKAAWITAVQQQKLPWISVNELKGKASQSVKLFNVEAIPANYIIDKNGHIVAKNLYGADLEKKVKELVKN